MGGTPTIAVATSYLRGTNSSAPAAVSASCGMVKWCFSLSQLVQLPYLGGRVEGVLITNDVAYALTICRTRPLPRMITYSDELANAVRQWSATLRGCNQSRSTGPSLIGLASLAKWQLLAHTEYRAILVTDLDIDLFLSSRGRPPTPSEDVWPGQTMALRHALTTLFDLFIESNTTLIASPDFHSPINTGVMLLKPSRDVYELGLRTLSTGTFDSDGGFNNVGRPHSAIRWDRMHANKVMWLNGSVMSKSNRWTFVSATGDQGLFVYIYLALQQGEYFEPTNHRAVWLSRYLDAEHRKNRTWWSQISSRYHRRFFPGWRVNHCACPE